MTEKKRIPLSDLSDFQIAARLEKTFTQMPAERAQRISRMLHEQQSARYNHACIQKLDRDVAELSNRQAHLSPSAQ